MTPTDTTDATVERSLSTQRHVHEPHRIGLPPLGPYVLPGNNYHVYDYALFWSAIRKDAERRLAAWH